MPRDISRNGGIGSFRARRKDRVDAIVAEIRKGGGRAYAVKADVTNQNDIRNLAEEARKTFGKIDVMVNNAGLMAIAPIVAAKTDEWDRMIDVNIKGCFTELHARYFLRLCVKTE